jgi:hypothetical protein
MVAEHSLENFEPGWAALRLAAKKALESKAVWRRIDSRSELLITSVEEKRIWLQAGSKEVASLTPQKVEEAMAIFNTGKELGKEGTLFQRYSIWEQTLIFLHPQLSWEFAGKDRFIVCRKTAITGDRVKAAESAKGGKKRKISVDEAWTVTRNNAEMARILNCSFIRPGGRGRLAVLLCDDEAFTLAQGRSFYSRVTSEWVCDTINRLNKEGEIMIYDQHWTAKARLNCLAFLHPQLGWDESGKIMRQMY